MAKRSASSANKTSSPYTLAAGHSLILRVCAADGSSQNGFKWPGVGEIAEAPDWEPTRECGAGLHGWLYGQGDHTCSSYYGEEGARWLVVEVQSDSIIELGGKVKFPRGVVRFVGSKADVAAFIIEHEARAKNVAVIGATLSVGDGEVVAVGALGTATAGALGTATAGDSGTATAGALGTATAGDSGMATAGALGTATAGYRGMATAGALGTATAGDRGTATAGEYGCICIQWYDAKADRYRMKVGYVGEDGIEPNVAYRVDGAGKFVKVEG